jgi:hypothetical protein
MLPEVGVLHTCERPLVQQSLDKCQHPTLLSLASYPPVIEVSYMLVYVVV